MEPRSSCPQCREGICEAHDTSSTSVTTSKVPRWSPGHIGKPIFVLFSLITVLVWWDLDKSSSVENILGSHTNRIISMALPSDSRWVRNGP